MRVAIVLTAVLCVGLPAIRAADEENPAIPADAPQATANPAAQEQSGGPAAVPPPEIMRPTEQGLRMTPALARALSRSFVWQLSENSPLTDEQRSQLDESLARRLMETARTHQELAQQAAEYCLETIMAKEMDRRPLTPETAREFAQRVRPMLPIVKEFVRGVAEDFGPVVDARQNQAIGEMLNEAIGELDKIEDRMVRWSNGEYKNGEDPFDNYAPNTQPASGATAPPANAEMQQAEERMKWTMLALEPNTWERFIVTTGGFFKFDTDQNARARDILARYRARAGEVMTPEWERRLRENRLKSSFRDALSRTQPVAPWFFHLQHEFDLAVKPLSELGRAFRREVLALVTPEQQETALAGIRSRSVDHGLPEADSSDMLLSLMAD